jgi:hypothetical protein
MNFVTSIVSSNILWDLDGATIKEALDFLSEFLPKQPDTQVKLRLSSDCDGNTVLEVVSIRPMTAEEKAEHDANLALTQKRREEHDKRKLAELIAKYGVPTNAQ